MNFAGQAERNAGNDSCVFQAWHWVSTHLKLWAFMDVYISWGSLQKYIYFSKESHMKHFFYFPLRVMVPFSITFGKTKNFWMMPLICSMFLKLCCFLLWKCLSFSPYHTVIFKTVVRYTGYSELIIIDYTHDCSQQRNSIFYKTIHIYLNAIGKFESLI